METFRPATRAWFEQSFTRGPTEVQQRGWERIAAGEHALLVAPTGSGQDAGGLPVADRRAAPRVSPAPSPGVRVLYVSPLKALVYDIERNLRAPLDGVQRAAERLGAVAPRARRRAHGRHARRASAGARRAIRPRSWSPRPSRSS